MSTTTAQVLRDAAAELEQNGWCQGALHRGEKSCLLGSLYRAVGIQDMAEQCSSDQGLLFHQAREALVRHLGDVAAPWWNDTPGRTQAEAVKALLGAADEADVAEMGSRP